MKYDVREVPQNTSTPLSFSEATKSHRKIDNSLTSQYVAGTKRSATQTIAFFNYKGGTGKTTSALSIGGRLAQLGKRVLLVDWDPQANATYSLGVDPERLKKSMADVILDQLDGYSGCSIRDAIITTPFKNLDLAPASLRLSVTETAMYQSGASVDILHQALEPIDGYYEYILLDMPSGSNIFMTGGLRAADQLVVPCCAGSYSLQGLQNLKHFLTDLHKETGHTIDHFTVLVTRSAAPNLLSSIGHRRPATTEEMEADLAYMFSTVYRVPDSEDVLEAQRIKTPITIFAPKSEASKAYVEITYQLIENAGVAGAHSGSPLRNEGFRKNVSMTPQKAVI